MRIPDIASLVGIARVMVGLAVVLALLGWAGHRLRREPARRAVRRHHIGRSVPLGRRNMFADPRRLAASVLGVGLAVMLILLLDGMWAGIRQQSTVYTDSVGADLYVLQPGVRDLTPGASSLPLTSLKTVRADRDVTWAAPVRTAFVILQLHGRKVAMAVVGSVPGQRGGPWSLSAGRAPRADSEVTVGRVVARRHGIDVGDEVNVLGQSLRVVGISNSTGFMTDYAFVTHAALSRLSDTPGTTSTILVGSRDAVATADRLRAGGLNILSRQQVAANDLKFTTGIFGSPIRLMVGIGLVAGTLIIALTAYTAIIERRREYGIVKALGASTARLVRIAFTQTIALAVMGLAAGWLLFLGGRAVMATTRPQFTVLLTGGAFGRAIIAAIVMSVVAAIIPARRLASLEPAVAYRSTS